MSSEPRAVAYCDPSNPINSDAFAWPGSDRQKRHSMPLYDEQALSALRAELDEVKGMCAQEAENNARLRCEKFDLEQKVDALRKVLRYAFDQFDKMAREAMENPA